MAFSDDEEETVPNAITNYHFEDKDGAPISFSVLPLILDDAEDAEAPRQQVSVRGTTDGGLQSVFKEVIAWKLSLGEDEPQVSVLSKENKWIKLEKPKKSFEECIRPTLITIHLLHFSKKNPEASIKSSWEHLRHVLGPFDDRPLDVSDHVQLLKLFMERDESLSNSQVLLMVVKNPENAFGENFTNGLGERPFIIDDELEYGIGVDEGDGDESEDESDLFDSVCSICDNGGELLCCEGRCLRSFHATKRAGEDSDCASLGLTRTQVDAMQNFLCKNCQLKKHQCFACGKLGSSDKSASAEVFSCVSATCGHFYHPKCVAHLLFPENKVEATELEIKIAAGQSFTCPVHRCIVCKQVENKEVEELQFAICRRCPKAYHRKCMPREISFEDIEDEDIIQRAWEGLLPNRILIYCMKHDIDDELGTPARDHIIFPESLDKKRERDQLKPMLKKDKQASDGVTGDINLAKHVKKIEKKAADGSHKLKVAKAFSKQAIDSSQPTWKASMKVAKSALEKVESKEIAKSALTKMEKPKLKIEKASVDKAKVSDVAVNVHGKLKNSAPKIPDEIRKDVLALVEEESSSLTLEDIKKTLLMPSTHASSAGQIDKSITLGKVEGAIEAVRTALEKLDAGGNVEDARAVCEPEILRRLIKWNTKLKVYLAPVLHGSRYSSYGRHFTKSDKLQEISDKLQWYVQDGDMVVDFCCGANEFSLLMKEKLDAAGKKCSFKNYDIFQAKNDFNFEMRDWMTVRAGELPTGSKLIMGLNPPFGVNARLANQFIDKALTFKPKLLILIVPEETRRLDQKNPQYDLIWEDRESLSGKSFYLPGSIDICDKQIEQWNLKPPVLYLWSRPDWTAKHKSIASSQGHTSKLQPALVYKDSPSRTEEHAAAVYKSSEEQYMECDATLVEGVSIKQNKAISRDSSSNVEPVVPIDAISQVERNEDASRAEKHAKERYDTARSSPEQREPRKDANKKKHTQESHGKRESTPAHSVSTREAHKKKLHSDEKTEKNRSADSKKRKSPDGYNDKTVSSNKMKHWEQHRHETSSRMEMENARDMSISPRDGREPIDVSASGSFDHSSGLEMRSRSSVGRPSSIHDGIDDISRKYLTPERGWSGAAVQEKDLIPNSDGRYGAYGNLDNYSQPHLRNSYSRPDNADLRSQIRTYGVQDEEIANGYGRLSDAELRAQLRTYGLQEEEPTNGYRRPSDADIRTQLRMYGRQEQEVEPGIGYGRPSEVTLRTQHRPYGIQTEEDHLQGSRYPLGGSVSTLAHSSLYPSSNYRFSGVAAETSTLQRYAPRLDEMNYSRPRPVPGRDVHGFRGEFSSGSIPPFPHQDSTGWIDD